MRVLNPGPGEIVDRLTVVARKIVEGGGEHFAAEYQELLDALEAHPADFMDAKAYGSWYHLLAATNAAIWQREDEIRTRRRKGVYTDEAGAEVLAFKIQELNDSRAKIVKRLNAAAGINREEKL